MNDLKTAPPETLHRRVIVLALGFFALFLAYNTAQLLQTSVNGSNGYTCLGLVYGWFALSSLFAPYFVVRFGPCSFLGVSGLAYVMMTASYLVPDNSIFLLTSCFSVGVSAAFLWTSQGSYAGACATHMSKCTNRALTDCTSAVNATFYSIFAGSGGVSAAFRFAFLSSVEGEGIRPLFGVLTLCGCGGIVLLSLLARPDDIHQGALRQLTICGQTPSAHQPQGESRCIADERTSIVNADSLAVGPPSHGAAGGDGARDHIRGTAVPGLAYMVSGRGEYMVNVPGRLNGSWIESLSRQVNDIVFRRHTC
jgi:hypothetical protein